MQILDVCILMTCTTYAALFVFFMSNIDEIW